VYICLIGIALLAMGIGMMFWNNLGRSRDWKIGLCCLGVIVGVLIGLCWGMSYLTESANVERYYALQNTLLMARSETDQITMFELSAITGKIAEMNEDLAVRKWARKSPWTSWFIPKAFETLKSLR